ncbi:polysaccharide pyruvyl transferase family protein [Enterobacter asburiae]
MKIAILTQPLHTNYGGNLQAFALQQVLKTNGYTPLTINYRKKPTMLSTFVRPLLSRIKRSSLNQEKTHPFSNSEKFIVNQHHNTFIRKNINYSPAIYSLKELRAYFKNNNFHSVIVGSDQTWRPQYSPRIDTFFLDFLKKNQHIRKLSYAASFGTDEWEFTPRQTKRFSALLKQFDFVSVREHSAASLCEKKLNTKATHVLDPTLLVDKSVYLSLLQAETNKNNEGKLFHYILDKTKDKNEFIESVASRLGRKIFTAYPKETIKRTRIIDNIDNYIYPSISDWLRGFHDASFIITDSFHGTVFSILFNKPFIAIANEERGKARFTSLLKLFNLEHRLVTNVKNTPLSVIHESVDYRSVNRRLNELREISIKHLIDNIEAK